MTEGKARHYRTARFGAEALKEWPNLTTAPVRVVFDRLQWNEFHKRNECLFNVYATMDNASYIGTYFENALEGFVL